MGARRLILALGALAVSAASAGCDGWSVRTVADGGHAVRLAVQSPCGPPCRPLVRFREVGAPRWAAAPVRSGNASLTGLRAGTTYEYQPCLATPAPPLSCGRLRRVFTPWTSSFEVTPWYRDWDGGDPTRAQPQLWPQDPPIGPIDAAQAGISRDAGEHAMRFTVSPADAAAGRIHAKLYKTWSIDAARDGLPGLGGDVSGVYSADILWPAGRRLSCRHSAPVTLFGWKEIAGYESPGQYRHQDPTWWLTVVPACWMRQYRGTRWVGPRPSDPRAPVVFTRWWNYGRGSDDAARRPLDVTALPLGRWFSVRATLRDGDSIDWHVAGRSLGRSRQRQYPVGPQYGRAPEDHWAFEVGSYGSAPGTLYVDRVAVRRPGPRSSGGPAPHRRSRAAR